jgi:hypothetical protein
MQTAVELVDLIDNLIVECSTYDFNVTSIICDGATTNRSFIKAYFNKSYLDETGFPVIYADHPVHGFKVFVIPDPSHCFKKFRNPLSGTSEKRVVYIDVRLKGADGKDTGEKKRCLLSLDRLQDLNFAMNG